jgi:beta-lactamase superfamily II metal-dependent hydrolase
MSTLSVTLIDVGSGDSILIETEDDHSQRRFALVDSNDEPTWKSTETFLLRHLRNRNITFGTPHRLFDFVIASHAHSDHISGLKRLLQVFGAEWFYYPESGASAEFAALLDYVRRSAALPAGRVGRHQVINQNTVLPNLGDVALQVLWPPLTAAGQPISKNENNNSIVLGLTLGNGKILLTGDCEADKWQQITPLIQKQGMQVFKVPHHGAYNGFFDGAKNPAWLGALAVDTRLGMSTHVSPYHHPDPSVITTLEGAGYTTQAAKLFRTDQAYHITFETSAAGLRVKHSRF